MEFYYPTLSNKKECRQCRDCCKACPVQALSYDNEWSVDKEKCKKHQMKIQDICMNCVEYCRKNVIQLHEEK